MCNNPVMSILRHNDPGVLQDFSLKDVIAEAK